MNAYYELFGTRQTVNEEDSKAIALIESLESAEVTEVTQKLKEKWGENYRGIRGKRVFEILPNIDSTEVREWVNNVSWACVFYDNIICHLKSQRTLEDEKLFLNTLKTINYNEGYGIQELYGTIVFKDGSWLDRYEYDGSEHWQMNSLPEEPDWKEVLNN